MKSHQKVGIACIVGAWVLLFGIVWLDGGLALALNVVGLFVGVVSVACLLFFGILLLTGSIEK